jgi:hypothetical protein
VIRRLARPFAIVGSLIALAAAIAAFILRIGDPAPLLPGSFGFGPTALVGMELLGVTFAVVGALLVVRRPGNAVGWCMVLIGDGYALGGLGAAITASAAADGPAGAATAALAGWFTVFVTTIGGLVFVLGFIFPTGRGHSPAWDRFIRLGAIWFPVISLFTFLIRPGPLHLFSTIENPFGIGPDLRPLLGANVSQAIAACSAIVVPVLAFSLVSRYRMANTIGRQQLKWFVLAIFVTIVGVGAAAVGAVLTNEPPEAGLVVFGFAGSLVPVAIGIAILRHGLYDIDRLISRTVVYGAITAVLAMVFGVAALVLGVVLSTVGEGQTIAVAGSTLLVAALFGPLRRRAQAIVDRRFDRAGYDAALTVETMTTRLRDDVDLRRVEADVLGVVDRTFHPASAGIWIRETTR